MFIAHFADILPDSLVKIWYRLCADFFMPSRLGEYKDLLQFALDHQYQVCSIRHFLEITDHGQNQPKGQYLILRHDIDTDVSTAKAMWAIEQLLSIKSSYYFRLSTLDIPFMREIEAAGGEVGYHYEEIATIAKQKRLKTRDQVNAVMPEIRALFRDNLNRLRGKTSLPLRIAASHGDFVNRKLGMRNCEILSDNNFREQLGIEHEVYDQHLMRFVKSRHADLAGYPRLWEPNDPASAITSGIDLIYVLVHPRQWRVNRKESLTDNIRRMVEGVRYRL